MIAAAATIGSRDSCGRAACAPAPTSSISNVSADAASGPSSRDDLPDLEPPIDVAAEDRRDAVERAALENRERAVARLFRRLKHHEHVAVAGALEQQPRGADGPRRVDVVPARVHDARHLRTRTEARSLR